MSLNSQLKLPDKHTRVPPAPNKNSLGALSAWCKSADTARLLGPCPFHPSQCCRNRSVRPAIFCSPNQSRNHHLIIHLNDYNHLPCLTTHPNQTRRPRPTSLNRTPRKRTLSHLCACPSRHPAGDHLLLLRIAKYLRLPRQSQHHPLRPRPSPPGTRGSAWHPRMAHSPLAHQRAPCHRAAQHAHWSSADRTTPLLSKDPSQGNGCT